MIGRVFAKAVGIVLWLGLAGFADPAAAGDQALFDPIGFSKSNRYFAFDEYGVQDGAGAAYSSIFIVDLDKDAFVDGSPYREMAKEGESDLAPVRAKTRAAAAKKLAELEIATPAQFATLAGDGEPALSRSMRFGFPAYGPPGTIEGNFTLSLETLDIDQTDACTNMVAQPIKGFALTLAGDGDTRELYHDGKKIPGSRGCPLGYSLYGVIFPYEDGEIASAVAIVSYYPFGFEGTDRRFLVLPIGRAAK